MLKLQNNSRALLILIALLVAAHLPALTQGFFVDDYAHQLALGSDSPMEPWSLYDFGTTEDWREGSMERGGLPWWTSADWKVRFFRPLSSCVLWANHTFFGDWAPGYAATSLLLYVGLLLAALGLFRQLGWSERASLGALALFGASSSSVLPVGWIANQNALLEVLFTVLAVRCALRQRVAAALLLALCAAASKESGALAFALVGAVFWIFHPARKRLAGLGLAAAVVWIAGLAVAGYGTRSAFYATPWNEPLAFAGNALALVPLATLHAALPFSLDMVPLVPALKWPAVLVGCALLVWLVTWGRRQCDRSPAETFLVLWFLITLVPQGTAPPSDRLLLGPMVAAAPLLARLLAQVLRSDRKVDRYPAWALLLQAGPLSFLALVAQQVSVSRMAGEIRDTVVSADVGEARDVFVLQAENSMVLFALSTTWAFERSEQPVRFWTLQMGRRALELRRVDERTFEIETLDEPMITRPFEVVYRSSGPPQVGERFDSGPFSVTVLEASAEGVRSFSLVLNEPLDASRHRFLVPQDGKLVVLEPPALGARVVLDAIVPRDPFVP